LSGTPRKARRMQRRKRTPRATLAESMRESFPLLSFSFLCLALRQSASQIIRHLVLVSAGRTPCYKSYGNSRALAIYTRFVEIVMNLRLTILPPGSRPESPVLGFLECTSYFVSGFEGCFRAEYEFRCFRINESAMR